MQRRRQLCDAAIQLLADDGVKGVTHRRVDRQVGLPDGTTSFYFRTRSALLYAVAARIAELDLAELTAATKQPSGLATLVIRSATGVRLTRTRARYELALQAHRDPVLAAALESNVERFSDLIRDAVLQLQPAGDEADHNLVAQRTYVLITFISGIMLAFARGDRTIKTAAHLNDVMSGIVAGITAAQ